MYETENSNASTYGTSIGIAVATGLAAAAAMYWLDPQSGPRRRALVRDQLKHSGHSAKRFVTKAGRDIEHRAQGTYHESLSWMRRRAVDDRKLEERVRAELGRLTSHAGAIQVSCTDGMVRLEGDVLESELASVLRGVGRVRGVRDVSNALQVHASAEGIPSLQGSTDVQPQRFEYLQDNWSPGPRLLAAAAGVVLLAASVGRQRAAALALTSLGLAALVRSTINRPLSSLIGSSAVAEDGIVVQKSIHVHATPEEAYDAWRDLERFPQFMSHVREVKALGDNKYRWSVDGPANIPVTWESEITADVPNELIAWHTLENSPVQSAGIVQFEASSYGGTRIHVRMSYRPPGNVAGQTIAKIFGRDPKRQMDDDLMRFKSYLEEGHVGSGRPPAEPTMESTVH